jgi:hypothetical protein
MTLLMIILYPFETVHEVSTTSNKRIPAQLLQNASNAARFD